ncbi:MAG: PPC domain-containing DNA-binding protein [Egibacteraceae bacterium]
MKSATLKLGRTFGVTFDHGESFFDALAKFCADNGLRQGYIPMFLAGFKDVELVGTCEKLEDPQAPVWTRVHLDNVEAIGGGTIAFDPEARRILPHVHVAVGLKPHSAMGHTSHLLSATVQFLVEMLVIEVAGPHMRRIVNHALYDVPLLNFLAE